MTPTEKAEAYTEAHAHTDYNYHTEDNINSYLAGHAEGRREALEMAQGLVEAMKKIKEQIIAAYSGDESPNEIASKALAKFEAWREGK